MNRTTCEAVPLHNYTCFVLCTPRGSATRSYCQWFQNYVDNHRHWEHLHILVLLETESWPCPVLLFWKLSIRRTLPVSQMPLLTQWREHGANIYHSTRKWAGYWGCRLLSPTEPSHRSGRAPHMLSLGIDCVFFLLSLDQALSQPNIFSNKE